MPLTPGSEFGPYRVIGPLGKGGMSSVYRVHEPGLDREVALKVLPAQFLHEPSFRERFEREARVVAKLEHHNIIPIHAFGVDEGTPWMAMRLVTGQSLAELRAAGPIPPERILAILREVAEAIDYAHGRGVLHRDVKPQNVLLDEGGHAYLADFGIARIMAGTGGTTQTGTIAGTPQYMAPEQARGEQIDNRCDIYSLGVVAYELFTGRVPFTGSTPVNIVVKHIMDPVPAPDPGLLAASLARPVLKCLSKLPQKRWPTALGFVEALDAGLAEARGHPAGAAEARAAPSASPPPPAASRPTPRPRERATRPPTPAAPTAPALLTRPPRVPMPQNTRLALIGGLVTALLLTAAVAARLWRANDVPEPIREVSAATVPPVAGLPAPPDPEPAPAPAAPASPAASARPAPLTRSPTLDLFDQVCESGDASACLKLGVAYWEGSGGASQDRGRAAELFERACEGGAGEACTRLGSVFRRGEGVLRNLARAAALYGDACQAGDEDGCFELGRLYQRGEGVAANAERARELFTKACEAGMKPACEALQTP